MERKRLHKCIHYMHYHSQCRVSNNVTMTVSNLRVLDYQNLSESQSEKSIYFYMSVFRQELCPHNKHSQFKSHFHSLPHFMLKDIEFLKIWHNIEIKTKLYFSPYQSVLSENQYLLKDAWYCVTHTLLVLHFCNR